MMDLPRRGVLCAVATGILVAQDEQRDLAKTIRVSGSILLSTVSNFLDFFKMEAGKALDIVRNEIDLQVRGSISSPPLLGATQPLIGRPAHATRSAACPLDSGYQHPLHAS